MKKIFLITVFGLSFYTGNSQKLSYEYPIKPGTEQWKAMDNTLDKVKACQIPDTVLKSLSTDELLSVCLKYPLLYDYALANSPYEGLMAIIANFNGFQEFFNRNDAYLEWFKYYIKMQPGDVDRYSELADRGFYLKDFAAVELC